MTWFESKLGTVAVLFMLLMLLDAAEKAALLGVMTVTLFVESRSFFRLAELSRVPKVVRLFDWIVEERGEGIVKNPGSWLV
jgi:hypothetical protein